MRILSLLELPTEICGDILVHLDAEDLLRLCRTCRALNGLAKGPLANPAWRKLCSEDFSNASPALQLPHDWAAQYKTWYTARAAERRRLRYAKLQLLQGSLQVVTRDIHRLQDSLQREGAAVLRAQGEIDVIRKAEQAAAASTMWVPHAVQRHFDRVVQQAPVDSSWRLRSLTQDVSTARMQQAVLDKQLAVKRREARALQRKILAMGG